MKKLVFVSAAALFAVALTLNVSLSSSNETGQTSLLKISMSNQAEAECIDNSGLNNGGCGITGNCYWGRESGSPCDAWRG